MKIIIITGTSGSGKSQAVNVFEDIGYFCVDNMPPSLIPRFAEMSMQLNKDSNIAVVCDVRTGELFDGFVDAMSELKALGVSFKILFIDATDTELIRRYRESRRKHPLAADSISTEEAIRNERARLYPVEGMADYRIDTTHLSIQQLRENIITLFLLGENGTMQVRCMSFGFKHGVPIEADIMLDVRFLPNPFYIEELKRSTGLDQAVSDYVLHNDVAIELLHKFCDLLSFLLPNYRTEGKSQLVIAIGCTGGKHRSVAIAEYLSHFIIDAGYSCTSMHRDIGKIQ